MRPSALVTLLDEVFRVGVLTQIGGDCDNLAVGGARNFAGGGFQRLFAPRAHRDVDAFFRQSQRYALADAFTAAGHQCRLALKLEVHAFSP